MAQCSVKRKGARVRPGTLTSEMRYGVIMADWEARPVSGRDGLKFLFYYTGGWPV